MSRKDDAQCFYAMELVEGETLEACHFANYLAELFARYLSNPRLCLRDKSTFVLQCLIYCFECSE